MAKEQTLSTKVYTPESILFEGELAAITSLNDTGKFSVLPFHTNFITIIHDYLLLYPPSDPPQRITIDQGVISVKKNKVEVFIGIVVEPLSKSQKAATQQVLGGLRDN